VEPIPSVRRASALPTGTSAAVLACVLLGVVPPAHASLLEGDALDTLANIVAWIAIIIVPLVLLAVFWWLHIMPEKIAEQRHHPQLQAIKVLCLLSLVFGGMLWPIAWIWAYTRPVLHQLAYGTDKLVQPHADDAVHLYAEDLAPEAATTPSPAPPPAAVADADIAAMQKRIASLEMQLAAASAQAAGRRGPDGGGA